MKYYRNTLNC